jgi:hypothetical protein
VLDEHVEFLERAGIEQHVDALARRQLALAVLRLDAALAAAQPRGLAALFQLFQHFLHSATPTPVFRH